MFSCEQEDLEGIMNNDTGQALTRATSSIADFDPISELNGIPVNILNVGNTTRRYLKGDALGKQVTLCDKDDGSLKQRWYVNSFNIMFAPDRSTDSNRESILIPDASNRTWPLLMFGTSYGFGSQLINAGRYYYIQASILDIVNPGMKRYTVYLNSDSRSGAKLAFKPTKSNDLALWEIVPVGEFRLIDVEYEKSVAAGDFINQKDQYVKGAVMPARPEPVEHTITISESVTESSNFTETYGVTTQNQSSFNWGIQAGKAPLPVISVGGSLNNTVTSSHTVSYSHVGNYDVSVSQSFKVLVPANKSYAIEVLKMSYNTSLTYVATWEKTDGVDAGKRFRIKGRWDGIITTLLYYNMYESDTKKLIETKVISE